MEKINFVNGKQPAINATNLNKLQKNVENEFTTKNAKLTITEDTTKGANVTIPLKYKVGTYCLDIFVNGEKLIPCSTYDDNSTGHYSEVGDKNTVSNTIKLTSDWNLSSGDYLEIMVRGEWS